VVLPIVLTLVVAAEIAVLGGGDRAGREQVGKERPLS
jgi:hypothetical protein